MTEVNKAAELTAKVELKINTKAPTLKDLAKEEKGSIFNGGISKKNCSKTLKEGETKGEVHQGGKLVGCYIESEKKAPEKKEKPEDFDPFQFEIEIE